MLKRHKRLIPTGAKKRLYESFILSHLNYCSVIWLRCGKKNADKLEKMNERCLLFVFNDLNSNYDESLDYINQPCLQDRRIHDMLSLTYRALNGNTPVYIKNLLNVKDTTYITYEANIFSMSPGLIPQPMAYILSVILLLNSGTRYLSHLEPLLRPMHLN